MLAERCLKSRQATGLEQPFETRAPGAVHFAEHQMIHGRVANDAGFGDDRGQVRRAAGDMGPSDCTRQVSMLSTPF
jgi:hypothetical protein